MTDRAWSITASAFARLLELLDSDRERAGIAYEQLRERTIGLFGWWGAVRPEELADDTLDRVARKLEQGTTVSPASLGAYVRGVARMVFYESKRDCSEPLDERDLPAPSPAEESEALRCLDECLTALAGDDRKQILRYYEGNRVEVRQKIAGELGISMTALRIRMHRLRLQLERCVSSCLAGETVPAS